VLLTAACTPGAITQEPAAGENRPAPVETVEAPPANPTFGESFEWSDGLSVTVSEPSEFTPTEMAFASPAASYLSFVVTIVNGSDANYDPSGLFATLQSGNTEAEQIFDFDDGFAGTPQTALLPGREVEFKIGFGVDNPDDLVMQIIADFTRESAIFTS
jgi:hypothetical protein